MMNFPHQSWTDYRGKVKAQQECGISQKERSLLARLRDSLGISESDAEAIESELDALASS
jgi:hypothetical protein